MTTPLTHTTITMPAAATDSGPLRRAWRAIHDAVAEMNYAAGRLVEFRPGH